MAGDVDEGIVVVRTPRMPPAVESARVRGILTPETSIRLPMAGLNANSDSESLRGFDMRERNMGIMTGVGSARGRRPARGKGSSCTMSGMGMCQRGDIVAEQCRWKDFGILGFLQRHGGHKIFLVTTLSRSRMIVYQLTLLQNCAASAG
jgi:hypothetical protein